MSNPTVNNLYGQTYTQIVDNVLGGPGKNFQLVIPQQDWNWTPPSLPGYIDPLAYQFVGQLPKWTVAGKYEPSGSDMHHAYVHVLEAVDAGASDTPKYREEYKEAAENLARATKQVQQDENLALSEYAKYKEEVGKTEKSYDDWLLDSALKPVIDSDHQAQKKAEETKNQITEELNPGLVDAKNAAKLPKLKVGDSTPPGFLQVVGTDEVVAKYNFREPKDWADEVEAKPGSSLVIKLSGASSSSAFEKSWAGGSASYGGFFFILPQVGGSWQKMDLETTDKGVEVNITIKAYTMIEVTPDQAWYDGPFLKMLAAKDTWTPPFSTSGGDGKQPVFGKGGILPLILTGMVVGYQPSIDIKMSKSTYSKHEQEWGASAGVRIGPFQFGASGGHMKKSSRATSDEQVYHVESTADYPFIMGITVSNPGE